jgi:3-methyladenine DNA glycosylase AlkD
MEVSAILTWLERRGSRRNRDGMARYGIVTPKAFGVSMATMRPLVKRLGRHHELALALWDSEYLEARILAALVDEPASVSAAQMERWAADFDNWAVCDSVCFHLFDRTPHAWRTVPRWARRRAEFVKRGAFAMLAGLAVHDKHADDRAFLQTLPLIERAAGDERNLVKKAVNWALRQIGKRNAALNAAAIVVAQRLADRDDRAARWIGADARRELISAATVARVRARSRMDT